MKGNWMAWNEERNGMESTLIDVLVSNVLLRSDHLLQCQTMIFNILSHLIVPRNTCFMVLIHSFRQINLFCVEMCVQIWVEPPFNSIPFHCYPNPFDAFPYTFDWIHFDYAWDVETVYATLLDLSYDDIYCLVRHLRNLWSILTDFLSEIRGELYLHHPTSTTITAPPISIQTNYVIDSLLNLEA